MQQKKYLRRFRIFWWKQKFFMYNLFFNEQKNNRLSFVEPSVYRALPREFRPIPPTPRHLQREPDHLQWEPRRQ